MSNTRARQAAAFAVHLLTASGAAVAFGALIAAIQGEFTVMFALLGLALLIDGIDGILARRLRVAHVLPRWSGETLDHVVDYLTYVFVPAYALASGAILPQPFAIPAAVAIVVSGAIYFADKRMKTATVISADFPVLWNLVAFYLFLIQPQPLIRTGGGGLAGRPHLRSDSLRASTACEALAGGEPHFACGVGRARARRLAYHLVPPTAYVVGLLRGRRVFYCGPRRGRTSTPDEQS
jgi:phosphatidylglycerophosphate synthase